MVKVHEDEAVVSVSDGPLRVDGETETETV